MRLEPHEQEADEDVVEGFVKPLVLGTWLVGLVLLPGLLVMQYLFFWNWKRVIDPNSLSVVLAGLAVWLAFAGSFAVMIFGDGA